MSQDPFSMNGGAIIAMAGDRCVAIAADRRLGENFKTVNTTFQKVFRIQDNILLGLAGLATDVQTLYDRVLIIQLFTHGVQGQYVQT